MALVLFILPCVLLNNMIKLVRARPNIVLILTDDEDVVLSEDYITEYNIMPTRDEIFKTNGIQFVNAFSSTPTCCVSRSSILTGKYVHNHNVLNNTDGGNCWGTDWQTNHEPFTYASYLHDIGYHTFFAGKYLNRYTDATSIPKGWDDWHGLLGVIDYYNYHLSNNGVRTFYDDSDPSHYHTHVIKEFALNFLNDHKENEDPDTPFLLVLSTVAAHSPFVVEDKYISEVYAHHDIIAPRTPNWNAVQLEDHHRVISSHLPMNKKQVSQSDWIFRHRLFTLKSVDDAIRDIYSFIANEMDSNTLDDTYFIYSSDHGFHSGQFGMSFAKMQLYETDIRVPFFISNSADGVDQGGIREVMANNIDIAPTILDIAGVDYASETEMDGKSLLPFMSDAQEEEDDFEMFLVEYNGEGFNHMEFRMCMSHLDGFDGTRCDSWNNTYSCIRWMNNEEEDDFIYCNFRCYTEGRVETACDSESNEIESKGEYYNLKDDPWQMHNIWDTLSEDAVQYFNDKIDAFKSCSENECRELSRANDVVQVNPTHKDAKRSFLYEISRSLANMKMYSF
eukprot:393568_1